jgi:peptide/nickel transport system substrate-binding protein
VIIQNAVKEIGVTINLNVMDQGAYYADAVPGNSPWLDSDLGITDYGHRGVPNVYLTAPLKSDGTWNSARFKNKDYDGLVANFIGALDLDAQKAAAGKIQTLLLDETPLLFTYFYDFMSAAKKGVTGAEVTAMSHLFLKDAKLA